jgi:hypothetical protein
MPKLTLDLEALDRMVDRKVVLGVVGELFYYLGLNPDATIHYPDGANGENLKRTLKDRFGDYDTDPRYSAHVNVEKEFLEEGIPKSALNTKENPVLFRDKDLGIYLAPVYNRVEMALEIQFQFPSRVEANNALNDLRRQMSRYRDVMVHEVRYTYLIPRVCTAIIEKCHELRENQAGYGVSYTDYVDTHMTSQKYVATNASGEHARLGKEEVQTNILGRHTFDMVNRQGEATTEPAATTLAFTYRFRFDRPMSVEMEYPFIVHNQPLPDGWYDTAPDFELARRARGQSRLLINTEKFTTNRQLTQPLEGVAIPHFHDWFPPTRPTDLNGLARITLVVDDEQTQTLFNLKNLGEVSIDADLIGYLEEVYADLPYYKRAAVTILLYEDDRLMSPEKYDVDADLNVRLTVTPNLRSRYYAWIGVLANLEKLEAGGIEPFCRHGEAALKVFAGLDGRLEESGQMPPLNSRGALSKTDFKKTAAIIRSRLLPIHYDTRYVLVNLGAFFESDDE